MTGAASFIGDIDPSRTAHLALVRSPHAHARITAIDTSRAAALPGVIAVFTGEQFRLLAKAIRAPNAALHESDHPILALGKVRYVGDAVVAVVAKDRYVAEDAVDLITVEYEPLPAVASIEAALASDAALVHDEVPANLYVEIARDLGLVDAARAGAAFVVEATFRTQRSAGLPIECRGAVGEYDAGTGRTTLWTSTQVPHVVRYGLAECLGVPEDMVRVVGPDVGGGFGNKALFDTEQVLVCVLAREMGRPVKWLEDRRENLIASTHGQEEIIWLRLAADAEGRFTALEADVLLNGGAYASFPDPPTNELSNGASCMVGPYKIPNYRHHGRAVVTTTCPYGPIRGVARAQANFALERLVDILARRMGLDPIELRLRNLLGPGDFPYTTVTGLLRDSGDYVQALTLAVERIGYAELKAQRASLRAAGRLIGVGVACFAEEGASGTARRVGQKMYAIAGYDGAKLRMDANARVTIFSSAAGSGQGHETTLAQLAADEIGVSPADITVRHNDTDGAPYGMGSTGSRTIVSSGGAVVLAGRKLREMLFELAAHVLGEPRGNLLLRQGAVSVRTDAARAVTIRTLASIAHRREGTIPVGFEPGLETTAFYDPPPSVSSNSTHAVVVEVDPETGAVALLRYVIVEDTGTMVNPMIVDGQVRGGATQGIAKALYEEVLYDSEGQPVNASLMDFLVPTAREIPPIEIIHMESPSPFTAGGMKGCGEGGIIGGPAAIGNAIIDAVGGGVELYEIPFTPERVLRLLRGRDGLLSG